MQIKNKKGQGLVEYLIIVGIIAISSIAVMRVLGETVQAKFASIASALQGDKREHKVDVGANLYKKKDLGNFLDGVEHKSANE